MLSPTPARIAFNIATRGLANTLGIPVDKLTSSIVSKLSRAEIAGDRQGFPLLVRAPHSWRSRESGQMPIVWHPHGDEGAIGWEDRTREERRSCT